MSIFVYQFQFWCHISRLIWSILTFWPDSFQHRDGEAEAWERPFATRSWAEGFIEAEEAGQASGEVQGAAEAQSKPARTCSPDTHGTCAHAHCLNSHHMGDISVTSWPTAAVPKWQSRYFSIPWEDLVYTFIYSQTVTKLFHQLIFVWLGAATGSAVYWAG